VVAKKETEMKMDSKNNYPRQKGQKENRKKDKNKKKWQK